MNYHEFWDALESAYPLSKGALRLPIATTLTPLSEVLPEDFFRELEDILTEVLRSATKTITEDRLTREGDHALIPLLDGDFTGIVRFDCMLDADGKPKIIELNADYPDGLLLHDSTVSVLSEKENNTHTTLFLSLFDSKDTIFVAFPKDAFFQDAYMREYLALKEAGFRVFLGNYEDLRRRNDDIFYEEHRIDTIRRCVETGKMTATHITLLSGARVQYINTFDLRTLGYKSLLSQIKHPLIPKSFVLSEENIAQFSSKNRWVAKPSHLSEGHGVRIGRDTNEQEWQHFLEKHSTQGYIMQEFVESTPRSCAFFERESIITEEKYFDFCPHFFIKHGTIIGRGHTLMRFSSEKILNVAQGGGIGYMQ